MDERIEATTSSEDPRAGVLQAIVDRMTAWESTAEPDTLRRQLDEAIAESDIEVSEELRRRIVAHVKDGGPGRDIASLLR